MDILQVRAGDTLVTVAARFETTLKKLLSVNPQIVEEDEILPGEDILTTRMSLTAVLYQRSSLPLLPPLTPLSVRDMHNMRLSCDFCAPTAPLSQARTYVFCRVPTESLRQLTTIVSTRRKPQTQGVIPTTSHATKC